MKKALIPAIGALALIVGFMGIGTQTAQAEPSALLLVNPTIVNSVSGGTFDLTLADGTSPATPAITSANVATVCAATTCGVQEFDQLFGGGNGTTGVLTAAEVTASGVDIDDNQLTAGTGSLVALVFVTNDLTITMTVSNGSFAHSSASALTCNQPAGAAAGLNLPMGDHDCDNNVATVGDGVVAALVSGSGATASATVRTMSVTQGTASQVADYIVVGSPNSLELTADETTVTAPGTTACTLTAAASASDVAALRAVVFDSAGTALTGALVSFSSSAVTKVKLAAPSVLTADNGTDNLATNRACGVATGAATITASACVALCALPTSDDVNQSKTVTITAVGVPAKVDVKADPTQIACDGTASSTVTATVTDSAGANVADGTAVSFAVVALGTANPINATTKAGVATSKVTPLSVGIQGVTVIVTAGSIQTSILISCSLPVPTATAVGGAPGGGGVTPPDTGSGGYLTQDGSAGFPLWTLVALALGSVALVAGGMVTRRVGR